MSCCSTTSCRSVDGMAVLDRLRADDDLAAVPVIMLTHSSDPELLVDALRRGAHDYLRTPFDPAELDARVRRRSASSGSTTRSSTPTTGWRCRR